MRRCIGCYGSFPQEQLLRFTLQEGKITPDGPKQDMAGRDIPTNTVNDGRGFYLCRSGECFDRALKKKAFNRVLKRNLEPEELEGVAEIIRSAEQ